jgi:tetratricopeptide (TPR) repeat protein
LHGHAAAEAARPEALVEPQPPMIPGYTLGRLLGAGGFSHVWEAAREGDRTPLAIKVGKAESPVALERFRRDAEAMERIGPPHTPKVSHLGRLDDGRPYLVMERLADRTLAAALESLQAPPGALWAAQAGLAVASALEQAHARGIIHRDLKPENIFLSEARDRATLIDFGLMRRVDAKDERPVTRDGTVVGTPEYMAPEQIRGEPGLDARADVYAFGVILFEMLTLRPPFAGEPGAIEHGHLELRPPRLTEMVSAPIELEELVLACLAKDPERRPAGASALIRALEAIGSPASASGPASMPLSAPISAPRSSQLLAEGRQPMIILVAETKAVAVQVLAALTGRKGLVARQSGARYVAVFSGADTDDPVHTALATARELVVKLGARVALHLAPLSMRRKLRGPPAVYGLAVEKPETWLPPTPWSGIVLTAELARAVPAADLEPCPALPSFFTPALLAPQLSAIVRASSVRLFGRDEVLAALSSSAEQSFSAAVPGLFTVIGDHGLGKSRIAGEAVFVALRVAPRARVITLRAEQPLAGGAGQTTRELLTQVLGLHEEPLEPGPEAVARRCAERLGASIGAEVWLAVAVALGRVTPHASPGTPRSIHHGAMRGLAEGLLALARRGPVVVVLDDAHWADDTALDALEYATLGASGCPLWVVVTAHPRFDEARRGFGLRAHRHDRASLDPLDEAAGVRLAAELLLPAEYPPHAALARLVAWSGGNPFCLAELVRTLKRAGIVRRASTGTFYVATTELDRLPPSPAWQWLAVKKLDALRPELSACVRLCSVLGEEFSRTEVEEVQDAVARAGEAGTHIDAGVGLQALVESGIFARGTGDRYSFQSPTFRDAVYELLDPHRRDAIHRVAFEVWRARVASAAGSLAPPGAYSHGLEQLARHAGAAGLSHEAAAASFDLAEVAWSKHRHVEADQRYTAALAFLSPDDSERRLRALTGRGKTRYRLHRVREALDDLRAARALAEQRGDFAMTADLLLEEATALDWAQSFEQSACLAEQARELIDKLSTRRLDSRLRVTLGRSRCRQQRLAEAVELLREGALGAEQDGDQDTRVVALLMLSSVLVLEGRLEEAEAKFHEVIALCGQLEDRLHLGSALANRSILWTARAAPDRAMEDLRRSIQIAREVGNPWLERNAAHNVAELLYWSGQDDEALALARRSRTLEERFVEHVVPEDSLLLARIQTSRGERAEARALLAWIGDNCPVDKLAPIERALVQALSMVLAETPDSAPPVPAGRTASDLPLPAHPDSAAWDRLVEEAQGFPPEELLEVLFLRARAAIRNGRRDEAVQCAVQSRSRLESCPIWRPRFATLIEEIDQVPAGACSHWSLEQAAREIHSDII